MATKAPKTDEAVTEKADEVSTATQPTHVIQHRTTMPTPPRGLPMASNMAVERIEDALQPLRYDRSAQAADLAQEAIHAVAVLNLSAAAVVYRTEALDFVAGRLAAVAS